MRALAGPVAVLLFALATAQAEPRGPRGGTSTPANEQVIVWSADSTLGPVYYPASAGPDDSARALAEDLARVLGMMAGREWPSAPEPQGVVTDRGIFVGPTVRAHLDQVGEGRVDFARPSLEHGDRTEVLIAPGRVVVNGLTPEATRVGAYRFAQEALGALWVQPGSPGEILPPSKRVALRAGLRVYQPDFYERVFPLPRRLSSVEPDAMWALRNGASRHLDFNHNLHRIFTEAVLTEHPEWAAWRYGARLSADAHGGRGAQPDLLNPDVIKYVAEAAHRAFTEDPTRLSYSLATNDSIRFDDSARTRALLTPWSYFRGKPDHSDLVFGFTQAVAETFESANSRSPEPAFLTQLAYMWAEQPPSFRLDERILPYLCSDRSQWYDPNFRAEDQELVARWSEAGPAMLGSWEYYEGQPYLIPRYFPSVQAESLAWLYDHRVRALFFEGLPVWGFDAPKLWLAAQLAWDAGADHERLLDDYFAVAYGAAAEPMARFFALAEDAWMGQPGTALWLKYYDNIDQFILYPPAVRQAMSACLTEARSRGQALGDSTERERVLALISRTEEAWAVTEGGARLYEAWREVGYPGAVASMPTEDTFEAFFTAQAAWQATDKSAFPRAKPLIGTLNQLAPVARWQEPSPQDGWSLLFAEDFDEPVLAGDLEGLGPETVPRSSFRRGWSTLASHAEHLSVRRFQTDEPVGASRLRVEGANYFFFARSFELGPAASGVLRWQASLRGDISPGCGVVICLAYQNADGETLSPIHVDILAPGEYSRWLTLAAEGAIPPSAVAVTVSWRVLEQFSGDWLEADSFELWYAP